MKEMNLSGRCQLKKEPLIANRNCYMYMYMYMRMGIMGSIPEMRLKQKQEVIGLSHIF